VALGGDLEYGIKYLIGYAYIIHGAGIATGYELNSQCSIPGTSKTFLLLHSVQIVYGAHPTSYPKSTGGSFLDIEMAEACS
jgi:hypothetical protein